MFRFTIRDLLWLMVVVAVCCASWIERERHSAQRATAKTREDKLISDAKIARAEEQRAAKAAMVARDEMIAVLQAAKKKGVIPNEIFDSIYRPPAPLKPISTVQPPLPDEVLERIKADSAALGSPQPKPLPPGYGETLNPISTTTD